MKKKINEKPKMDPKMDPKSNWENTVKIYFIQLLKEYNFKQDELTIVFSTCENLNLFWQASHALEEHGLFVTTDTGQVKKHPANEISKNAWSGFLAGCRLLKIGAPNELKNRVGRPDGGKLKKWFLDD